MSHIFDRVQLILGKEKMDILKSSHVAIFGVGGVGGYALESLVRIGVGEITIIDADTISETNINRQIIATTKTIGLNKVDVAEARAKEINPDIIINKHKHFYLPDNKGDINLKDFDFVIDAIDTVSAKIDIITGCKDANIPIVSCFGCGNRIDPTKLVITDIYKTEMDPLAKVIRKECRNRGIKELKVVYSKEPPLKPLQNEAELGENKGKAKGIAPGSTSFVPSVAGIYLAYIAVEELFKR